jgi:hypothetical protein
MSEARRSFGNAVQVPDSRESGSYSPHLAGQILLHGFQISLERVMHAPSGGVASTRGKQMPVLTFQEQSFELLEAGICRASAISC